MCAAGFPRQLDLQKGPLSSSILHAYMGLHRTDRNVCVTLGT